MRWSNRYIFIVSAILIILVITGLGVYTVWKRQAVQPPPTVTPSLSPSPTPTLTSTPTTALIDTSVLVMSQNQVQTLDPYLMVSMLPEQSIAAHLWDTVVRVDDNSHIEPGLAESWEIINDYVWEFKLRPNAQFHNGEPVDAYAVQFSLERSRDLIGSLETFYQDVGLERIEIRTNSIFRLHITRPMSNFLYKLATIEILPPGYYGTVDAQTVATHPIGSGPFQFDRWSSDGSVILNANPDYWRGAPSITTIIFRPEGEMQQRLAARRAGLAQIVTDISPAWFDPAEGTALESTRRLFVGIRCDDTSPLADARVRKALNYAINVERIIQETQAGYGQRYSHYINMPDRETPVPAFSYQPEQAQTLLGEAGYGQGFTTWMDVPKSRYTDGEQIAQLIAHDLHQIGITVELRYWDWHDFVRRLLEHQSSPLFLLSLRSDGDVIQDAQNLSWLFPWNPTGWYNKDFQDLLDKATFTYNIEKRAELLQQAQDIVQQEAPWIFLWRPFDFYSIDPELDWSPRPDGLVYLYQAQRQTGN